MKQWKKYTITFFGGFIAGVVVCGLSVWLYMGSRSVEEPEGIITTTIEGAGEKIKHSRWRFKGKNLTFRTTAKDKGATITKVDKKLIPEVRYWNERVNAVQVNYIGAIEDGRYYHGASLLYYRRFGMFAIGGGLFIRESDENRICFGVQAGGMVWF